MAPSARYAAITGYVDLSRSLGLDPAPLMRDAGLDPAGLCEPDRWAPAHLFYALLESSARASGCDDFGLRLAERRRFANLGPLSLALREEPDVRGVVTMLCRHEAMFNESLRLRLAEGDGISAIQLTLDAGRPGRTWQAADLALGVLHGLLRHFLGNTWQPLRVNMIRPEPRELTAYRRVFGPSIGFGADHNEIVLYTSDLDAANHGSDPLLRSYVGRILAPDPHATASVDRVRDVIEQLLPTGRCSVQEVARSLGLDRRTVHRHLARENKTFSDVLDDTRALLADHLVAGDRHSLTEVASLLGFSSPSNFSRWFRGRFGENPRRWRQKPR